MTARTETLHGVRILSLIIALTDNETTMEAAGVQCRGWSGTRPSRRMEEFRQHVELMFSGPLSAKEEEQKCSYLLLWIGEKGRDIFNT